MGDWIPGCLDSRLFERLTLGKMASSLVNPDTHKFVVNPGKSGKLRVGKSESPRKMGA